MNLLNLIKDQLRPALAGMVDDVELPLSMVKPTQDPKLGDYQANCAMSLAKKLGKKPREIAQEIVDRLPENELLHPPEIAGPGFINFRLKEDWLAKRLQEMAKDDRLGVEKEVNPKTIVIDFSSPNVAKPLHVGHLRSTIIGDSLTRLFRFMGHKVITDNHLGDWGTQFGIILYGYKNFLDKEAYANAPVEELLRLYKKVRELMKNDEEANNPVAEAARKETAKLHEGDPENLKLWQEFMPWCMSEINGIYERLDVKFDFTLGESFYHDQLPGVVESLKEEGVAQDSAGAVAIFFGENEPPSLVQKSDGAFTYTTTDLATIQYRVKKFDPEEIIYVVDFRQSLHFQNLFAAAKRWGYDKPRLLHISFGSVLGEDGKPLKTREGTGALLDDLLNKAIDQAGKVYQQLRQESIERGDAVPEMSDQELATIQETVGIGAVKYADLSQNRKSDYKFSFDKMLAMDGNTATYMQYAYVRNRGIFRKGEVDPKVFRESPPLPILEKPQERALALNLLRFEEALLAAEEEYQPSGITSFLWDLAKAYSAFFVNCPVLKAEMEELRQSRLLLCDLTARVIQKGLELLGIRTVERM